jgi:putative Holliday junction resolvase
MRVLGVDHGTKRIGLAISDETGIVAQSIGYVANAAEVLQVASKRDAGKLVVGVPRRLDGTASEQTERAMAFIAKLKAATKLPVIGWDERLTTAQATRVLIEGNVRRKDRKEKIDQLAAQLMLQSYLDVQSQNCSGGL